MGKQGEETKSAQEEKHKTDLQLTNQVVQQLTTPAASPPPSSTSSPSHEFSFTISLNPPTTATAADKCNTTTKYLPPLCQLPFAATIDLSPADEIFFHGHLLPLHLLSHHHQPISADSSRSSTNSLESCTFTLKDELLYDHDHDQGSVQDDDIIDDIINDHGHQENSHILEGKVRGKSRSFSHLFPKWRKYHHNDHDHDHDHHEKDENHDHDDHKQKIRKSKFDIVKRYMRLVKPFIPFRHKRGARNAIDFLREPSSFNSYSGSLRVRKNKKDNLMMRAGRRSEFSSAPVSPTNSGLLVASGNITPTTNKNDGTMEELQAAIQAAIAHCKNSIAEEGEKEQVADKTAT
ncbi:hypothetical protein PHJA_002302100 [Phtheirospermum japonicum]|uniref:BRI1 kinase inhibitor 1 n=1 Tax=Phtheirospermum japonicum TaxID=374723 RepID=A0A830D5A5_9LAMI|nr:hypothetical protein PHJA_002302100 [Phtheirospermum japonicum]